MSDGATTSARQRFAGQGQFSLYTLLAVVTLVCLWAASAHWPAFQLAYRFAPWAALLAGIHLAIMATLTVAWRLCCKVARK